MEREPGSAMHIHQSVVDTKTGKNIFTDRRRRPHRAVPVAHRRPAEVPAGGDGAARARTSTPTAACARYSVAPINVQWGYDNRTAGLRVPTSTGAARRVENRLAGADANPYLAIAASLACGYLGMIEG